VVNKIPSPLEDILELTRDTPVTQKQIKDLIAVYTFAGKDFDIENRMDKLQTIANINPEYQNDRRRRSLEVTQKYMARHYGGWND
jgi:hypothetical protein